MPQLTVGYDQFKNILGSGIKSNLSIVTIPTLIKTIGTIVKSKTSYFRNNVSPQIVHDISELTRIQKFFTDINDTLGLLSLARNTNYPAEGFDIITNSYWTRKTVGKINLNPLTFTFAIDSKYRIYDLFNFIKNGILLDKEHGVYNYPQNYMIDFINVYTYTQSVYKNKSNDISGNFAISSKHYVNCILSNLGEITKDTTSKDTLEEFTVTFEYEYIVDATIIDVPDIAFANSDYESKLKKFK